MLTRTAPQKSTSSTSSMDLSFLFSTSCMTNYGSWCWLFQADPSGVQRTRPLKRVQHCDSTQQLSALFRISSRGANVVAETCTISFIFCFQIFLVANGIALDRLHCDRTAL